jgi:glucose uptake protein GlcU
LKFESVFLQESHVCNSGAGSKQTPPVAFSALYVALILHFFDKPIATKLPEFVVSLLSVLGTLR